MKVNKSHAAGYAILSYRTAYLKTHYFLEYSTAVLRSVETDKKLALYSSVVKSKGVEILFPHINKSNIHMDIYDFDKKIIITGLMAIKGLSEQMAVHIVEERTNNGDFKSFDDLLKRMSKYHIDKKTINCLVGSGALDDFDKNYSRLLSYYEYMDNYYKKKQELSSKNQKTIYDMPIFSELLDYLQFIPDNDGYSLEGRLANLCEYNLVGIHKDVTSAYKGVRHDLTLSKWQKNDDFENKEGTVSGIIEEEFALTKKGTFYIGSMKTFDGDSYKLIVSKDKASSITDDIFQYKKGMVLDVTGSFKIPKQKEEEEEEDDEILEEENQKKENADNLSYPKGIKTRLLENSFRPTEVELNFDKMNDYSDMSLKYFGVKNVNELLKLLLSRFPEESEKGKRITVIHGGHTYTCSKKINISLDEIKKIGCMYKVI